MPSTRTRAPSPITLLSAIVFVATFSAFACSNSSSNGDGGATGGSTGTGGATSGTGGGRGGDTGAAARAVDRRAPAGKVARPAPGARVEQREPVGRAARTGERLAMVARPAAVTAAPALPAREELLAAPVRRAPADKFACIRAVAAASRSATGFRTAGNVPRVGPTQPTARLASGPGASLHPARPPLPSAPTSRRRAPGLQRAVAFRQASANKTGAREAASSPTAPRSCADQHEQAL